MARPKMFFKTALPLSVVKLVRAYCADFERREQIIRQNRDSLPPTVIRCCEDANAAIEKALANCEEQLRTALLYDVADCRGYEWSRAQEYLSKDAYYRRKQKLIYDIAVELNLAN